MMKRIFRIAYFLAMLSSAQGAFSSADIRSFSRQFAALSPVQQEEVKAIAEELRCPTCTGLSVMESDAPFSLQMRSTVLEQVVAGQSREAIVQFFVERYGPWILREPPRRGLHLFAWLLPCALLILGPGVLVVLRYRRKNKHAARDFHPRSRREISREMQEALAALRRKAELAKEKR
jgi:cytochrome c-type biogenesis protein CcmH